MSYISNALHIAKTGLSYLERELSLIAQNLAAQGVLSFKRLYQVGTDLPYMNEALPGVKTSQEGESRMPIGIQIGSGVQSVGVYRNHSQGLADQTGNPLDIMIDGDGFYTVNLPNGAKAYTRLSALQLSAEGKLVMPKTGYALDPEITIPKEASSIAVNPTGEIYYETATGEQKLAGMIKLARFINPNGLKALGDSLFIRTEAAGEEETGSPGEGNFGVLKQQWRENSNVNMVEEVIRLVSVEKNYDAVTKVFKTADKMKESGNQISR